MGKSRVPNSSILVPQKLSAHQAKAPGPTGSLLSLLPLEHKAFFPLCLQVEILIFKKNNLLQAAF